MEKERVKCTCECHNDDVTIIHMFPCCDNGYVEIEKE